MITFKNFLTEATLQALLKSGFKKDGTIASISGRYGEGIAELLGCKPEDDAYIFHAETPDQKAAEKSIRATKETDSKGSLKMVRVIGGSRIVVVGDKLITCQYHYDKFVE